MIIAVPKQKTGEGANPSNSSEWEQMPVRRGDLVERITETVTLTMNVPAISSVFLTRRPVG